MTTISSHALQPRTQQALKASRSWSLRSLQIAERSLNEGYGDATSVCAKARSVAMHNLGMLAEVRKSRSSSTKR